MAFENYCKNLNNRNMLTNYVYSVNIVHIIDVIINPKQFTITSNCSK